MLASFTPCKTAGTAPEEFPIITLPYQDQWDQTDVDALVRAINKASSSDQKLQIAEDALTSTFKILTPGQASLLYESFTRASDMLALTEFVKDRIVGLTCAQVKSILNRFPFSRDRLEALEAFKHNIIDVENGPTLLEFFNSDDDKVQVLRILEGIKPKNSLFGIPEGKVVFLINDSPSMATSFDLSIGGRSSRLEFVQNELIKTIKNLDKTTQFTIMSFDYDVSAWKDTLQEATQANIIDAVSFARKLDISGGDINLYAALKAAWAVPGVETVYLLNDALPTLGFGEDRMIKELKAWNVGRNVKLNTILFMMGNTQFRNIPPARKLMSGLAEATNGIYRFVESDA